MDNKKMYTYDELINQICECAQSIMDNAESILGNERYFNNLEVSFQIFRSRSAYPTVQVTRNFTPELEVEDLKTYNELKRRNKNGNNME